MPRAALSTVSLKQLVAEIERRKTKLANLVAERDRLAGQIEELQALAGQPPPVAAPAPKAAKPGRKLRAKRATGKPLADYVREALAGSKGLSLAEIEAKVRKAGYPTKAKKLYGPISKVVATGFNRVGRGIYALLGGAKAAVAAPKPAVAKPAAKAKKGKRTFSCPTCKKVFASGMMVGAHYKAEPSHRKK
jgi:chorismate mutase